MWRPVSLGRLGAGRTHCPRNVDCGGCTYKTPERRPRGPAFLYVAAATSSRSCAHRSGDGRAGEGGGGGPVRHGCQLRPGTRPSTAAGRLSPILERVAARDGPRTFGRGGIDALAARRGTHRVRCRAVRRMVVGRGFRLARTRTGRRGAQYQPANTEAWQICQRSRMGVIPDFPDSRRGSAWASARLHPVRRCVRRAPPNPGSHAEHAYDGYSAPPRSRDLTTPKFPAILVWHQKRDTGGMLRRHQAGPAGRRRTHVRAGRGQSPQ